MKTFAAPHPNLTATYVPSDMPECEDDSVTLTHTDGRDIGSIQICDGAVYGGSTEYTYTLTDPKNAMSFFIPGIQTWRTYEAAAAAAVARCAKEGIAL